MRQPAKTPAPTPWTIVEPDLEAIRRAHPRPLEALAAGDVPALVLRGAYPPEACRRLVARLIVRELLYDPEKPVPRKFLEEAVPEGYFRPGVRGAAVGTAPVGPSPSDRRRIDIGTSLGYRGDDRDAFFAHSAETLKLFEELFDGLPHPIELIYSRLSALSLGRRVVTARETDGRLYGPAIIRAHYGGYTYRPHFDSVRLREKRQGYAVHRFEQQFAGVLVLQNAERSGETAQCVVHRYLWQPEVQPHLDVASFGEFAKERGIEKCRVVLEPGDLYFFNSRSIHEVPGGDGRLPRIVLATFIGYSPDADEIFVWS